MVFALLLLLLLILYGIKISGPGKFNEDYLKKEVTTSINGIFVILIVFSHYKQYADFGGVYDAPYLALREHLNQMVVASFLFYSGYGMMEAIKRKGEAYVDKLPSKFWQLLFRFDIAVILFLILDKILGIEYPPTQIALAFTSWTSVGNSNWYITAILMIYVCMFLAFKVSFRITPAHAKKTGILITIILIIGCVFMQIRMGRPGYCYNTMILASLGMLWSEYKSALEKVIMKNEFTYLLALAVTVAVYAVSFPHRKEYGIEGYTVWAVAFTILLVLITMKARIHNKILEWFGAHVFSIYILQRIPMMILDYFGLIESYKYISLVAVFVLTIPLAIAFEKLTGFMIDKITGRG